MYKFQLSDARASIALRNIAGVASASNQFVEYLNEAMRRIAKRGDFYGMVQTMDLVFQGSIVAWPRQVGTVLGIRSCTTNFQLRNQWYSFTGNFNQPTDYFFRSANPATFEDTAPAPVFNDIVNSGNGMLIRYYVTNIADIGKTITLFGTKYGAQPLQETSGGATVNGLTLTAASPYATTAVSVTSISSITRQATQGMAYLYQYDPTTNTLIDLAVFEPSETNPQYRRSRIQGYGLSYVASNCGNDPTTPKYNRVEALVKLDFIPVKDDRDFLLVDDFDALKFMIQAIKAEEANDNQTAEVLITKCIRELNFNDRNKLPTAQTPVFVTSVLGGRMNNPI